MFSGVGVFSTVSSGLDDSPPAVKEPNVAMHPTLKENAEKAGFEESRGNLVVFGSTAEVFDPDCKFDSVVTSCTLCSVSDEVKVIQNIGSWLRPGGKFYFLEHGGDEAGTWRRTIQDWATPMWSTIAGGCTLNRHHLTLIKNAVDEQGNRIFSDVTAEVVGRAHMNDFSPSFIFKPLIVGVATRSDYSTLSDKNVL